MITVGIVGHSGYSGAELVKILRRHPRVEPVLVDHRSEPAEAAIAASLSRVPWSPEALTGQGLAVVFLATPAEVSLELAPVALDRGIKVIDLSGAFRLPTASEFQRWYHLDHPRPDLLAEAAYGLPEFCRQRVRGARLVANPGCYPTAANLALKPLLAEGLIDLAAGVVCDAKSGVSGAGKKPTATTHFSAVAGNLSAYSVFEHRHVPEILLVSGLKEAELSFTAQLLPVHRGILETIYFRARQALDGAAIERVYRKQYEREPFVRIHPDGRLPDLHGAAHTNYCDIGIRADPATRRVVVIAAIDNLVKGAAGQAVQNMNLLLGLDETEGLL